MKPTSKAPFNGEEAFVLIQAITRRILFLEEQMVTFWNDGNDHGLRHVAHQIDLLKGLHSKVGFVWTKGRWPEEKEFSI